MLKEDLKKKILNVLSSKESCKVGILDSYRIYIAEKQEFKEMLVLLESACNWDSWGHVFYDGKKWVSSLLGISGYFGGDSDENVIEDFWINIKKRTGWRDLWLKEHLQDVSYSENFTEATLKLISMIENYELENEDTFNGYEIYDVYGVEILESGSKYYR